MLPKSAAVFPNQLRIGDRFTSNEGEWVVASRPVTFKGGHEVRLNAHPRDEPGTMRELFLPAYERLKARRAT